MWHASDSRYHQPSRMTYPGAATMRITFADRPCSARNVAASRLTGLLTAGIGIVIASGSVAHQDALYTLSGGLSWAFAATGRSDSGTSIVTPVGDIFSFPDLTRSVATPRPSDRSRLLVTVMRAVEGEGSRHAIGAKPRTIPAPSSAAPDRIGAVGTRASLLGSGSHEAVDTASPAIGPLREPSATRATVIRSEDQRASVPSGLRNASEPQADDVPQDALAMRATSPASTDLAPGVSSGTESVLLPPASAVQPTLVDAAMVEGASRDHAGESQSTPIGHAVQTPGGVEFSVRTRINGTSGGPLTLLLADSDLNYPQYAADNISIRLSDIIALLGPRMQPDMARWLAASSGAQSYVTLNDLRAHGILVSFDDQDRLVFRAH